MHRIPAPRQEKFVQWYLRTYLQKPAMPTVRELLRKTGLTTGPGSSRQFWNFKRGGQQVAVYKVTLDERQCPVAAKAGSLPTGYAEHMVTLRQESAPSSGS